MVERNGKPFLTESYDPKNNVSTFTFGEAVDGLKDRNAQFEVPLFLDPAVVQKSGRTHVGVIVDHHQPLQRALEVDYLDYADRPLSLKSHLYNVDYEAGTYTVNYRVSPGLYGKAVAANGQRTTGSFPVEISDQPVPARVNADGEVVRGEAGD